MDSGAGSRADSTRPALPTTISTSGRLATAISSFLRTRPFSATPAWGMDTGINRKDPSSREGINSFSEPSIMATPSNTTTKGIDTN